MSNGFYYPSVKIRLNKERFTALRKTLKALSASDNKAAVLLRKINERAVVKGSYWTVALFTDEATTFVSLFAVLSEDYIDTLTSVKSELILQRKALYDTENNINAILDRMQGEDELITTDVKPFRVLQREESAYIKRYIRDGCGGTLIAYGEEDYKDDERLTDITKEYLQSVADYLSIPLERVNKEYKEMLSSYESVKAIGYTKVGKGDKTLTEEERTQKEELLHKLIPMYCIDFSGFQYTSILAKELDCTDSLYKRALQWCKENL